MKTLSLWFTVGLVAFLALATTTSAFAVPGQTTYSGRAYAAYVNTTLTGPFSISDTGELPSGGGVLGNTLLSASVPGVLTADVLVANTSGASGNANSSASLANVTVLPGSAYQLTASFLRAETHADCNAQFGTSEIAELQFMGQNVVVTGQPNQTISVPGVATLVINEQGRTNKGTYHEIRVNAIHLVVNGIAEVILSSAKSDIRCATTREGPCHDFVTGGGWIDTGTGKANFGFNAGIKDGNTAPECHFNLVDNGADIHMKATNCTFYGGTGTNRTFKGACEINGQGGFTYNINVADNGEPGRNVDVIDWWFNNSYHGSGTLRGGNIQIHAPCAGRP